MAGGSKGAINGYESGRGVSREAGKGGCYDSPGNFNAGVGSDTGVGRGVESLSRDGKMSGFGRGQVGTGAGVRMGQAVGGRF